MRCLSAASIGIVTLFFSSIPAKPVPVHNIKPAEKILIVRLDETGVITDGLDTIAVDDLAFYIRERLFKNYMGTGKMYDKIKLQKLSEDIPAPVLEVVVNEIAAGQKAALTELCLHKYKKHFDSLEKKQQDKLRKQFLVLFQSDYT